MQFCLQHVNNQVLEEEAHKSPVLDVVNKPIGLRNVQRLWLWATTQVRLLLIYYKYDKAKCYQDVTVLHTYPLIFPITFQKSHHFEEKKLQHNGCCIAFTAWQ